MRNSVIGLALRVFVTLSLISTAAFAAGNSSGCPTTMKNILAANNVSASFSNSGSTTTYTFMSLTNENPVGGVPGLVKYCVYPTPSASPTNVTVQYDNWISKTDPTDFAFIRPSGNKTNIPLNGKTTVMGTATWGTLPTDQTIILHIADPTVCASIYGGTSPTCFVKPSPALSCSAGEGETAAAYNAIPFGGVNCAPPSVGVEAYGFNELGDQVLLAGTARTLDSLKVLFTSYGCSVSGHWYSGDCVTTPGATFNVPITAKIYDPSSLTVPIATVQVTQTIPYRPSADPVKCPDGLVFYTPGSQWFNPLGNGGAGACQYSIGTVLTFTFPAGTTLPDNVIWTVSYNTSHSGYNPIAVPIGQGDPCSSSLGGCGYDSLNVGIMSYPNSPYAGIDVDESVVFINWWQGNTVPQYPPPFGFGVLTPSAGIESTTDAIISGWTGYRPLGEIITK